MDKQRARRSASIPVRIGHAAAWAAGLWKQEHLRTLITGVQRFVLCAVLAQGTILGGYMPFGLAMTAALMARGAGPVSYTHLDVYKRQPLGNSPCVAPAESSPHV